MSQSTTSTPQTNKQKYDDFLSQSAVLFTYDGSFQYIVKNSYFVGLDGSRTTLDEMRKNPDYLTKNGVFDLNKVVDSKKYASVCHTDANGNLVTFAINGFTKDVGDHCRDEEEKMHNDLWSLSDTAPDAIAKETSDKETAPINNQKME